MPDEAPDTAGYRRQNQIATSTASKYESDTDEPDQAPPTPASVPCPSCQRQISTGRWLDGHFPTCPYCREELPVLEPLTQIQRLTLKQAKDELLDLKAVAQSSDHPIEIEAKRIAEWMLAQIKRNDRLPQHVAADYIAANFDNRFVYINPNGNRAIDKVVLEQFKKLTGTSVIWDRRELHWRLRCASDDPSKRWTK